jgi:hypothetical protein
MKSGLQTKLKLSSMVVMRLVMPIVAYFFFVSCLLLLPCLCRLLPLFLPPSLTSFSGLKYFETLIGMMSRH